MGHQGLAGLNNNLGGFGAMNQQRLHQQNMSNPYAVNSNNKLLMNTNPQNFVQQKMLLNNQHQSHNLSGLLGNKNTGSGMLVEDKFGMKQAEDTNFLLTQLDCGNSLPKTNSLALGAQVQGGMGGGHYNDPLNFHMDNKGMNLGGLNDPNRRI